MLNPLIDRAKHRLARVMRRLKPEATGDIKVSSKPTSAIPETAERLHMHLKWRNQLIGSLTLDAFNAWHFAYADSYKQAPARQALFEFPNLDQVYNCQELWPFFASRIPSPNQPEVQAIARRKEIDLHDTAQMLREFGGRTITNPYELAVA